MSGLARALTEAACREARADAKIGHRNLRPGSELNDDDDRKRYENAYDYEYEIAAQEVRRENEKRRREAEEEIERKKRMTPEERRKDENLELISYLISFVIIFFLFKGCVSLLMMR